ncbi:ATP-grasp ribosomal peptide maturase [Streptomyces sp. NEAU-H3]|uniref:ATP-grasp ribosomal peptide maturase n=1 Tax=Streptomyces sp. NEAU-H3 TaxID=2720636 RepID=UPI00143B8967|nr:ATP-grasp ribosomal peptide maturase [Streptomyces sp. NEAU-H3]NJA57251.1 ATP-grasp ribosomal peptide maturase [Streptomyces sp. NEAU-H3]
MTEESAVLVATEAEDATADLVIARLNERGVPVVRFDPADIERGALALSARFGARSAPVAGRVRTPSRALDLTRVRAVYWRRPQWPTYVGLGRGDARYAAAHVRYGLGGVLRALDGPLWVNHPSREAAADYKPAQLALARRLSLDVPPTLVTNEPAEAREFITTYGLVIHKPLRATPYERDGVRLAGWAEPVTAEEIDDSLRSAPHLFQARVRKVADVRVLVVGRRLFAVRIDSGLLDWRRDYSALTYAVIGLPPALVSALRAFLEYCGLESGSFDLALDTEGRHWFLELNPNGQWGWLEGATGLPLSAAFADFLTRGEAA